MGAPKQKWTAEEEAALKAGVVKHGAGKWRTILLDPEFSSILHLRSNVDLKDKWRNIKVMANGWGSRSKARLALKSSKLHSKHDDNGLSVAIPNEQEIVDAKPLAVSSGKLHHVGSKEQIARLDNLIFEAITKLKEPRGSDRATIAMYIEEQYWSPPNLKKLLSAKLNHLTANGKLTKAKHRYRIAPSSAGTEIRRGPPPVLLEEKHQDSPRAEKSEINMLSKPQVDAALAKMRGMTAQEAAAAAAQAVAEAEAAIAEAEEAAREAEAAEAEAEAAQVFAKAAMKALKCSKLHS